MQLHIVVSLRILMSSPQLSPSPWIQGTPLLNRFWKTMPFVASTGCVHTKSQTHAACTGHRGPSHGGAPRAYMTNYMRMPFAPLPSTMTFAPLPSPTSCLPMPFRRRWSRQDVSRVWLRRRLQRRHACLHSSIENGCRAHLALPSGASMAPPQFYSVLN